MSASLFQRLRNYAWPLLFAALILLSYFFYRERIPDWDEPYYMDLIVAINNLIQKGQLHTLFSLYQTPKFSGITSLPLYFTVLGYFRELTNAYSYYRLVNVILLFFCTMVFLRCRKKISPKKPELDALGFLFFPVTFTLSFLLYNDYTALSAVLFAFLLEIEGNILASALVLFIGFFIRQSIAPWFVLVPVFGTLLNPDENIGIWPAVRMILKRPATLFLIFCVLVFIYLNHGFSMGDKISQASGKFSVGNLFNFYFFCGLFFLPSIFRHAKIHFENFRLRPLSSVFIVGLTACALYIHVNAPLHAYNGWLDHKGTVFIRNWVVHLQKESLVFQAISFFLVLLGALEINLNLNRKTIFWLTLGVVLSIAPFNVIDIRYGIIPMTFYLLFKKRALTFGASHADFLANLVFLNLVYRSKIFLMDTLLN